MSTMNDDEARESVRDHYARVADGGGDVGCAPGCCGSGTGASLRVGYSEDELAAAPAGADLGLGCGTPLTFARLSPGETVLDLGSGGGLDCFLAARQVGPTGRIIGVDMTAAMVTRARDNAGRVGVKNVEFRLGEIERLPVADRSVDAVLSNCVINLSPDKPSVYREAFRVLRPGGRLAIADVVASAPLPAAVREDDRALAGCVAGAMAVEELRALLAETGFTDIRIDVRSESRSFIKDWLPGSGAEAYIASASIEAVRPAGNGCCGSTPAAPCC